MGFEVLAISGMYKKVDGTRTDKPIIPVQLTKTVQNKSIFNLRQLSNMRIKVETQKMRTTLPQCHRCQKYGHSQYSLHETTRCVKCDRSQTKKHYLHKKII